MQSVVSLRLVKLTIASLLLLSIIFTFLSSTTTNAYEDEQNNNDDDDVLDVSDETFDSDRDRRSRFSGGENQMEYEDFGDFTRQQQQKQESKQDSSSNKKEKSSSSNSRKEEYQKKKDEYYKDNNNKKEKKERSSSSSSSSSQPPKTLTEKLAYLTKTLEDIKSDFSARQNHLLRVSTPSDIVSPRHFNSSLNSEKSLKLLSQLVSSFGIEKIVDGDVLTRANSALSTARADARSLRNKIDAAEKQQKKQGGEQAPTGDSLPTKDHKLIALLKNIKIAEALVEELVEEEMKQRVAHKRLLRAAKTTTPTARKFFTEVVNAAEVRLSEMRGARSGEIDNAAPSSGNAREERLARKRFTQTVKVIKQALQYYQTFEKLVAQRSRSGTGLTKSMEPLFVLTQIIARDSFHLDCFELLVAADEQNSGDSDKSFGELGTFILEQYATYSEKMNDASLKEEDKEMAKKVFEISPTTSTGVTFGLETSELLGLVLCLVVPIQLFNILFVIVSKILDRGSSNNKKIITNSALVKNARVKKHKEINSNNKKTGGNGNKKTASPQSSFIIVIILTIIQLILPFLVTDLPPAISSKFEEFPINFRNTDVTLPSVLFSILRLQVSDANQARLACGCFLVALFQGLSVARSIAVFAPKSNENEDGEGDEGQQEE